MRFEIIEQSPDDDRQFRQTLRGHVLGIAAALHQLPDEIPPQLVLLFDESLPLFIPPRGVVAIVRRQAQCKPNKDTNEGYLNQQRDKVSVHLARAKDFSG